MVGGRGWEIEEEEEDGILRRRIEGVGGWVGGWVTCRSSMVAKERETLLLSLPHAHT